jgi:hypothetical protein
MSKDQPVPQSLRVEVEYDGNRTQSATADVMIGKLDSHGVIIRVPGTDRYIWAHVVDKSALPERYTSNTGTFGTYAY